MTNTNVLMFRGYNATSRAISAVGASLVMGTLAVAVLAIVQLRHQAAHVTHQRAQGQAVSLAAHAKQAFTSADFILRTVQREVRSSGVRSTSELADRFGSREANALQLFKEGSFQPLEMMLVADANGNLITESASGRGAGINVADREYFQRVRDSDSDTLWVSTPVRTRVYGTIDFFLSRRLESDDGQFLGVVAIGMSSRYFSQLYEDLRMGRENRNSPEVSSISLLRSDMAVIARAPPNDNLLGSRLASDGAYAPVATASAADTVVATQTWDSAKTTRSHVEVVARDVTGFPLRVAVATDDLVDVAGWRRQAWMIGSMALAAVIVFAYTFRVLARVLRRREGYMLENERLRYVAEAASTAKSQFLATVSHEIRTPMNGILGTAELLAARELPEEDRRLASMLLRSGRNLLGMLDDVLDFSKIEAGELTIVQRPFELQAVLDDVLELFAAFASMKGLALNVDVATEVPIRLVGDSMRIRQVIANLVGNAVKFTDTGFVAVHVSVSDTSTGARDLRCVIEDTGVGIPKEAHDRIFDHFAQADSSVGRRFGGTGLGLAISKRLARLMGGDLDYVDREDRGTCFHFTLPIVEAPSEPDGPESRPFVRTSVDSKTIHCALHVLVTEDNAVNALVTEAQLASLGCTCDIAVDGEDALAHLAHGAYDVVLMDCMLPGVSGYEAASLWRAREQREGRARLPIIALTANVMSSNVAQARLAGMDDFLTKPCSIDQLRDALLRAVPKSA